MDLTLPIYQDRRDDRHAWTTIGLGPFTCSERRRTELQVHEALVRSLRTTLRQVPPARLSWFSPPLGARLHRLRLELTLHGEGGRRKVSGLFPLIVEERPAGPGRTLRLGYHPARQEEWFPLHPPDTEPLSDQATLYFQRAWASLHDDALEALKTPGKDSLRPLSFRASPKTLIDELPRARRGLWDDLLVDPLKNADRDRGGQQVLPRLGDNLTSRAIDRSLPAGTPRSPYREQLQLLLCGARKQPVILCGPPGCGKTTLLYQWIYDLLDADDFPSHRNLDRAHVVYALSGRRLIAGMSYVGDWQQRCLDVIEDARRRRTVILVEDLHLFGRLGRSRQSESNFAELLRGPLGRGELVLAGECTREQLQRLEDDAPSFAAQFTVVPVEPTTPAETLRMLLNEGRALERRHKVQPQPQVYRSVLELSSAYFPGQALPGKALHLLRALLAAEDRAGQGPGTDAWQGAMAEVGGDALLRILSKTTGLPLPLLSPEETLSDESLRERLRRRVIGQDEAVEAAVDLVARIKAGLCDPGRPCAVYLLTGPTGVGKTELARCLAEVLYGSAEGRTEGRLVRIDMGEYGGPDAPRRLIGDRWGGEGTLTRPLLEQPFCVVLLDEIEKAHPQVLHLLLQLFEDGRLTDAGGRTADFTQAVVIMTSNLGARARATIGFGEVFGAVLAEVARAVREFFPPELLNRIDRVVPFRPLTPEVARAIADKEIRRLLQRRGLTERNVFVTVDEDVVAMVAAEAFDARDGARSLKRFIEDRIGGLLSAELSAARPAALRACRLSLEEGNLRAAIDPMDEAEPLGAELPLEPLLDLPARRLQAHLGEALAFVEGLLAGPELSDISGQMREHLRRHHQALGRDGGEGEGAESADRVYQLDSMRLSLEQFRDRLQGLHGAALLDEAEELEAQRFSHIITPAADEWTPAKRYRLFDRRFLQPLPRRAGRDELLDCLAEAQFLRRALRRVHDPDEHAVIVVVDLPMGLQPDGHGTWLASELVGCYLGERGEVEGALACSFCGVVEERALTERRGRPVVPTFDVLAFKRVGLCVRDALRHEHGCHVWRSLGAPPELCRVRVLPAPPGRTPLQVVEEAAAGPVGLLPLVRTLCFDPPEKGTGLCEIEDYVLGFTGTMRVRRLSDALERLFLLRTGREGA